MTDHSATAAALASELWKEAYTMALYVAVCLLAALTAIAERADAGHVNTIGLVWGTTIGLAMAHLFAFRLSARLVAQGVVRHHDAQIAVAQLIGAAAVAVLGTVPVLVLPGTTELDVVRLLLAGFIAVVGYAVAERSGARRLRSALYAASVLVVALAVALTKNVLSGH